MSHDNMTDDGGTNGGMEPCWIGKNCQLAQDQRAGNHIMTEMLHELKEMNANLVGPATSANRVPLRLFVIVCVLFTLLIAVEHVTKSGYELSATPREFSVTRSGGLALEKKTE
jgi:hypothetical protein